MESCDRLHIPSSLLAVTTHVIVPVSAQGTSEHQGLINPSLSPSDTLNLSD